MIDGDKIALMSEWAADNGCTLQMKGEVGFMRPCVGYVNGQAYVDYDYEDVTFAPENAYHKHDCLAVLVHDEDYDAALEELYNWTVWIKKRGMVVRIEARETYNKEGFGRTLELMMGGTTQAKLVYA